MGNPCYIWDPMGIIKNTLRQNPQVRVLKDKPEENTESMTTYTSLVSEIKLTDIQKVASALLNYNVGFGQEILSTIEKAGIKPTFDIGIHLVRDISGPNLPVLKKYVELIKVYQKKARKDKLSIYVMADNYSVVTQFQTYCDPTWKVTSLSKTPSGSITQTLADIYIMTSVPAMILEFDRPADRFIYMMQKNKILEYFAELKSQPWYLL